MLIAQVILIERQVLKRSLPLNNRINTNVSGNPDRPYTIMKY